MRSDSLHDSADSLGGTVRGVGGLAWNAPADAHREIASLFGRIDVPELLAQFKRDLNRIVDPSRSVEKTTHYKWFLAADPERRFEVWLHDYKPKTHRREGHASVPHNHRFWLTSLVLRGGFTDTRFQRTDDERLVAPEQSRAMRSGDRMVIDPDEIHALSDLQDETLSLIVQSRPIRSYSEVFEGGEVRRYSDLGAKLTELGASL